LSLIDQSVKTAKIDQLYQRFFQGQDIQFTNATVDEETLYYKK